MPAEKHTKKADTPKAKRQWQHVRDSEAARGASKGEAIRKANAVVRDRKKK
jgi:hypothetical protein